MKKDRMYGLDILRILSMIGIIGLHIINQGGLAQVADTTVEGLILRTVSILFYSSVNIFAMLTGYLYVQKTAIRSSNLLKLLLTCAFYCVTIMVSFMAVRPEFAKTTDIYIYIYALFPPLAGRYWYITSYVLLFMLIPYLNAMIRALKRIQFQRLLLILFLCLSVVTTFGLADYFKIGMGYTPYWLIFCYLVGAYIKLYKDDLPNRNILKWALFLAADLFIVLVIWFALDSTPLWDLFQIIQYTSPFMVIEAALLLLIFSKLTIDNTVGRKLILSLSNGAFGVYLIHSHILIFDHIITDAFIWVSGRTAIIYIGALIGGLIGIYLICWVIDTIRSLLFRLTRIDRAAEFIGSKLDAFLHWNHNHH